MLSMDDQERRARIVELMTRFVVDVDEDEARDIREFLRPLFDEGVLAVDTRRLVVPPDGRAFLRHAASFFDVYYRADAPDGPRYSTSA